MLAQTQYRLSAADLEVVLAMVRTGTLAAAGERLGVDASTVFRSVQRIERGLGQTLFARSRTGYLANELALSLAERAEQVEAALEAARSAANTAPDEVAGTVRITTTDTILIGLVAPALQSLQAQHPNLSYDDASGRWAYTEPDWAELKSVVTGHGPASQTRLGFRRDSYADTQWVRDALLGNATAAA